MLVSNALILQVQAVASADDYDSALVDYDEDTTVGSGEYEGEATTQKWADAEGVAIYWEQKTVRVTTAEGTDYLRKWTLYMDLAAPPVVIEIGDLVTIGGQPAADGTSPTYTCPVQSTETRQEPDLPVDVQSRALIIEPASPD